MKKANNETRRQTLEAELARILPLLIRDYGAEKVILFGSLATGDVGEWSDLDLVVIKRTKKRFFRRLDDVLGITRPRISADLLVYTPEEFGRLSESRRFFREEILAKGMVLYEG